MRTLTMNKAQAMMKRTDRLSFKITDVKYVQINIKNNNKKQRKQRNNTLLIAKLWTAYYLW